MIGAILAAAFLQAATPQAEVVRYEELATLDGAHTAVRVSVVLAGRGASARLPLSWTTSEPARVDAPAGATARVERTAGGLGLSVLASPAADTTIVRVYFTLPGAGTEFEHRFVGPGGITVKQYALTPRLPPGAAPHSVSWSAPKAKGSSARSPLQMTRDSLARVVSLTVPALGEGDVVQLTVEMAPERRSPIALVAGVALAIAWLVGFRDLVRPGKK